MAQPLVTTVDAVGGDHREMRDGETFLSNSNDAGFAQLSYKTKRKGRVAYDANNEILPQYFPIFVSAVEYARIQSMK
jgi:hypothetical protein